jgi:hypothetical protein
MRARRLSREERAHIPEFIEKWIAIGLSTTPVDLPRAERALCQLYISAGLVEPHIVWVPCPLTGMLSAIVYTKIRASGRESNTLDDRTLAQITERITQHALTIAAAPSAHRAMHLAVERAASEALSRASRIWSGFDPSLAINQTRRAALDRVLNRSLDDAVHKTLHTQLISPIRAGLGILEGLLQPALNTVGYAVLGPKTRRAGLAYSGAPFWAPYAGKIDYVHRVLGIPLERSFLDAVESCGLYWMFDGICFVSDRPAHINRDEAGHLHCEVGPGVAYPSGWSWWHWHGTRVPQSVIEEPERITVETIKQVRGPALRRVVIERYGHGKAIHGIAAYLRDAGARQLDQDAAFGTLWHLDVAGEEPTLMAEVVNHSPEPDGTYRHFFLQVHPELSPILSNGSLGAPQPSTARNAVASTFGLTGAEYRPEIET